jgi:hypothetical protein
VAMMAERGVSVSHTTVHRWVIRYVPEFEKRWNRFARPVNNSWRVDETYVKVRGKYISGHAHSRSTLPGSESHASWPGPAANRSGTAI